MLIIFIHYEGATDGQRTGAHDQRQQDHERVHGVQVHTAKVQHHGDVPIFLKGPPGLYKRRGASVPHPVLEGGRFRKQGQ